MFLGIEIGGTKLQLGVGRSDGSALAALERHDVQPQHGAEGILRQIEAAAAPLIRAHNLRGIGCGFGGPVDSLRGRTIKSHQIDGWADYPLVQWLQQRLALPVAIGNDCDVAGLAEAHFGAGRGNRVVFYVTVGTGIGGGLILDGRIHQGNGIAAAEIGHMRPGPQAVGSDQTVESIASGWGIAAAARERMADKAAQITAQQVAQLAEQGDAAAVASLDQAVQTLAWAIAQVVTLLSPGVVVVGGGVSLMRENLFLEPLREQIARYVFPPLSGSYRVETAQMGETVVVHGALKLAADAFTANPQQAPAFAGGCS